MIELGKMQKLLIVKKEDFGVYLAESAKDGEKERVLLPKKQVPEGAGIGDSVAVFIYRDSSDRLIATTKRPGILLHAVAPLRVSQVTKIGAFLDWGLEKDLLLPFSEQTRKVREGEEILAALYVDKSGRLAATMKLYPYLRQDPPYRIGDMVTGTVYQYAPNFGTFVAVDSMYSGMISREEAPDGYPVGQLLALRIANIKEDGKLDLSARRKAYEQMDQDAEKVMRKLHEEYGGVLPFDDKAAPERIREVFGLSKAAFKRAAGRLYKEKRIVILDGEIREV
ncbi:MAG: RNA-binding protein [Lachnospiraceae bacterium]|nr:RNA-binding protein [Lachnospiraceae bacterium]